LGGRKKRRGGRPGETPRLAAEGERLYPDLYPQVRSWFVVRMVSEWEADDLAQEVFAQFAPGRIPADSKAYLDAIASKVLARHRRQKAKERAVLRRLLAEAIRLGRPGESDRRAETSGAGELDPPGSRIVEELLAGLPRADAELLRLRFIEGLRVRQIARKVGCSTDAAYKRLQRLIRRLRRQYGAASD
jgi:RNA polymerase sigma factor (sigma-70 family)